MDANFDQSRQERADGFIIRGARFAVQDISFEAFSAWIGAPDTPNGDEPAQSVNTTLQVNLENLAFIEQCIAPESLKAWQALVARKENPLTQGDIAGIASWLIGQHTERPTIPPSSSGPGRQTTTTGSSAAPPSQAGTR